MKRAWLKQLRTEKSLTQAALASSARIKPARYSRIEAGYCDIRDKEAEALAKALNQTIEFIQSGRQKPEGERLDRGILNDGLKPATATIKTDPTSSTKLITPKGLAAAKTNESTPPIQSGDDLGDPKHFNLMPPTEALVRGTRPLADFRSQLQQHMAFADRVLHTSKVSPPIWVAWRNFNKEAQNLLRGGESALITASIQQQPPLIPIGATPVKPSFGKPPVRTKRGNKNIYGYFVEVAKESLSPEKYESLSTLATDAKKQHPELGFMKHFKGIAEAELSPTDFSKIAAEAAHRFSS